MKTHSTPSPDLHDSRLAMHSSPRDLHVSRLTSIVSLLLILSCSSPNPDAPFDTPDRGLLAVRWGMSADSVVFHLREMPGVRLSFDTTYSFENGYAPIFRGKDSVDVLVEEVPVSRTRLMAFHGGIFLGDTAIVWTVNFHEREGLQFIHLTIFPPDRRKRRFALMRSRFDEMYTFDTTSAYGPSGTSYTYEAKGIGGSATEADTHVMLSDPAYGESITVSYMALSTWKQQRGLDGRPRKRISREEWERRYEKEETGGQ